MPKTTTVSNETCESIKNQLGELNFEISAMEDFIGKKMFIRTVTYHLVGEVEKQVDQFWKLKNASWVADSGRFMNAIKEGILSEVEPVGECLVNIQSIVDMFPWNHKLPMEQK